MSNSKTLNDPFENDLRNVIEEGCFFFYDKDRREFKKCSNLGQMLNKLEKITTQSPKESKENKLTTLATTKLLDKCTPVFQDKKGKKYKICQLDDNAETIKKPDYGCIIFFSKNKKLYQLCSLNITTQATTTQATTTQVATTQAATKQKKITCKIYYDKKWVPHNLCNEVLEEQIPNEERIKEVKTNPTTNPKIRCVPWPPFGDPMCKQFKNNAKVTSSSNRENILPIIPILSFVFVGIFFISIFMKFNLFREKKERVNENELREICEMLIEKKKTNLSTVKTINECKKDEVEIKS